MKSKIYLLTLICCICTAITKAQVTILNQRTIGGSSFDGLTSLQITTDGGYILGGVSSSDISGEKTENSRGDYDCWVVKLNARGVIQWDKTIGGSSEDQIISLLSTKEGGYILGCVSFSNISGEKTENSRGGVDYWIVKLDANGNIQWDRTIGGSSDDYLGSLQPTIDGGYILGGAIIIRYFWGKN